MSVVKEVYVQTGELLEFLQQFPDHDDERDAFLETLDLKLVQREALIKQIAGKELSAGEKQLGEQLLLLNKKLTERMEQIQSTIRRNMNELEQKKKTGLKYENPYDGPSSDGIFFDQHR